MTALLLVVTASLAGASSARAAEPGAEHAEVRHVAVVRVAFSLGEVDLPSEGTVRAVLSDQTGSVNASLAAQTDGALQLQGLAQQAVDVLPAGGLPLIAPPAASCDAVMASVQQAVVATFGLALDAYDHVIVAQPRMPQCTWTSQSEKPGRWIWINGALGFDRLTLAAGLARNLGAGDAATLVCRDGSGARVPLSAQCDPPASTGDPTDVMGQGALLSAYHRAEAKLLPGRAQQTASAGEITLSDASQPGAAGTRLLLVPRSAAGAAVPGAFAIELRNPVAGLELWQRPPFLPMGVMVRLVPGSFGGGPTQLLDMTPATASFADAALGDQQTFTDPVSGVRIAVVSTDGDQAVVRIGGAPVTDTRPPVFMTGGLRAVVGSAAVTLTYPRAVDSTGVDHYEVRRDGQLVGRSASPPAVDRPPLGLPAADYDIAAVDAAGNATLLGATRVDLAALGISSGAAPPAGPSPSVPSPSPSPAVGTTIAVISPRVVSGRGKLSRSRLLTFRAIGAGRIVVKVDGRKVKDGRVSKLAVRLSARQARKSTVIAVASRGSLTRTLRTTVRIRSGRLVVG